MGTGICLFLDREKGFGLPGLGITVTKMGIERPMYHYKDGCNCSLNVNNFMESYGANLLFESPSKNVLEKAVFCPLSAFVRIVY
jgi:hypothetical protein